MSVKKKAKKRVKPEEVDFSPIIPDGKFATNFACQRLGNHLVKILFYETKPRLWINNMPKPKGKLPSHCICAIIIPSDRMDYLIDTLKLSEQINDRTRQKP